MRFPGGALPNIQNLFWKQFWHKVINNYYMKKKKIHTVSVNIKKGKKKFLHMFQIFNNRGGIRFLEIDPYIWRVLGPILST